jgi:hypothetical protein
MQYLGLVLEAREMSPARRGASPRRKTVCPQSERVGILTMRWQDSRAARWPRGTWTRPASS